MRTGWVLALAVVILAGGGYAAHQQGLDGPVIAALQKALAPAASQTATPRPAADQAGKGKVPPSPVEVAIAATASLSDDVAAIGTLLAEESVAIAPETNGRIAEILFADGHAVAAGQTLFRLDTELADAAVAEAAARLKLAQSVYDRSQELRKSGNIAQTVFDAAATELEVARATLDSAETQRGKLTIAAPFAGTLGFRLVSRGAYVTAGTPLVQLDMIDRLRASFAVPETQLSQIAAGQTVDVTADALPGENFKATVSAIEPSLDVNGRALRVRADLDNAALRLRPGLLVRVLVRGHPRDAVTVPEAAVVQRGATAFIYVIVDNKARQVKVRLGKRMPGAVEVVEGIAAGDTVVTAGNARLADGAAVDIVQSPPAVE
jgi:membrane fusion protein, multidrug efflux system